MQRCREDPRGKKAPGCPSKGSVSFARLPHAQIEAQFQQPLDGDETYREWADRGAVSRKLTYGLVSKAVAVV